MGEHISSTARVTHRVVFCLLFLILSEQQASGDTQHRHRLNLIDHLQVYQQYAMQAQTLNDARNHISTHDGEGNSASQERECDEN